MALDDDDLKLEDEAPPPSPLITSMPTETAPPMASAGGGGTGAAETSATSGTGVAPTGTALGMNDATLRDPGARNKTTAIDLSGPNFSLDDFLNFRVFVFPSLVKMLYLFFTMLVVLSALLMMLYSVFKGGAAYFFIGLAKLIIGPVVVRIGCEMMIVWFRIYEELRSRNR